MEEKYKELSDFANVVPSGSAKGDEQLAAVEMLLGSASRVRSFVSKGGWGPLNIKPNK